MQFDKKNKNGPPLFVGIYSQNILHNKLHILLLVRLWHASMHSFVWMFYGTVYFSLLTRLHTTE